MTDYKHKITYAVDSLDPNPLIRFFDEEHEAIDFLQDERIRRVDHIVQHAQHTIDDDEFDQLDEIESTLSRIDIVEVEYASIVFLHDYQDETVKAYFNNESDDESLIKHLAQFDVDGVYEDTRKDEPWGLSDSTWNDPESGYVLSTNSNLAYAALSKIIEVETR